MRHASGLVVSVFKAYEDLEPVEMYKFCIRSKKDDIATNVMELVVRIILKSPDAVQRRGALFNLTMRILGAGTLYSHLNASTVTSLIGDCDLATR